MTPDTVGPLMRVTVAWGAGPAAAAGDIRPDRSDTAFVFGIGPGGLVPFEHLIAGRSAGEEVRFTVDSREAAVRFLGHLTPAFLHGADGGEVAFVVRIARVERPDPREVVRALAATTDHGPCDCGCGCGGPTGKEPLP